MFLLNVKDRPKIHYMWTEDPPDMADFGAQRDLTHALKKLLRRLYENKGWYVCGRMKVTEPKRVEVAPDVFMAKVARTNEQRAYVGAWDLGNPFYRVPALIFEISSSETFKEDLGYKVKRYREMGVEEYFVYNPSVPVPDWDEKDVRLKGWYFVNKTNQPPITHPTYNDWLWSEILQRWLVRADHELHLYDAKGKRELTDDELGKLEEKRLAEAVEHAERERNAREAAERRAEKQRLRAEQLEKEREAERQAREVAEQRKAALRRKLIEQGLNPDDFL
jgi:Uma2 family endonuclease